MDRPPAPRAKPTERRRRKATGLKPKGHDSRVAAGKSASVCAAFSLWRLSTGRGRAPFCPALPPSERGGRHETLVHRGGIYGSFGHCHDGGKGLGGRALGLGAPRRALVGLRAKLMDLAVIPFLPRSGLRGPRDLPSPVVFRPLLGRTRPGRGRKRLRPPSTPSSRCLLFVTDATQNFSPRCSFFRSFQTNRT